MLCINTNDKKTVETYLNTGFSSALLDPNNPSLGLTQISVSVVNNALVCSLRRDNLNSNSNFFNINNQQPFLIAAYGNVDAQGSK